jgi:predicted  nucleic acid-binding Zn-ribbon protein
MTNAMQTLQEIYAVRRELADAKQEIEQGPLQLKGSQAKIDKAAAVVAGLKEELKALRKTSDAKELQLKSSEARVNDLKGKLNSTTNTKDYTAIKEEMTRIEALNSVVENEALEMLAEQEKHQEKIAAAEAEQAAAVEKHAKLKEIIDNRVAKNKSFAEGLIAKLQKLEGEIDPDFRGQYDRLTKSKGDRGMAPCSGGSCGACHNAQTPQSQQELAMGRPIFCSNCGALLFRA